jgi:hypothetical protein
MNSVVELAHTPTPPVPCNTHTLISASGAEGHADHDDLEENEYSDDRTRPAI